MKHGPRWVQLMTKTRGRKSRATVPLRRCGVIPVQIFGSHIRPQLPGLGLKSRPTFSSNDARPHTILYIHGHTVLSLYICTYVYYTSSVYTDLYCTVLFITVHTAPSNNMYAWILYCHCIYAFLPDCSVHARAYCTLLSVYMYCMHTVPSLYIAYIL